MNQSGLEQPVSLDRNALLKEKVARFEELKKRHDAGEEGLIDELRELHTSVERLRGDHTKEAGE
ncbi:hypothetical protein HZA26_00700 [Candidatus Nomurabacteria bacterium]|nr:hypothetical protein [Candidatus Nomurabacteria bacterium]